jgi:hypothetical protein
MESINNFNNFISSLLKYKQINMGLIFQGKEVNYKGYSRQKAKIKIDKKRIGFFPNNYKIVGNNIQGIYFPTFGEIFQVNGIICECNGYEVCFDIPNKQASTWDEVLCFTPKSFTIETYPA